MKIALVSATIRDNDVDKQIHQMEYYLSSNNGVDLFCFGENYLQGFNGLKGHYKFDIEIALPQESFEIKKIQKLAQKYHCAISFGYFERDNENIYCSNMVIDRSGTIIDNYRRQSIGWKLNHKDTHYKEGQTFQVFKLNGFKIVTAICGDLWTDKLVDELESLSSKVDIILWPLYIDYPESEWKETAREEYKNQLSTINTPVLMINSYSNTINEAKGGAIVFNKGQILQELPLGNKGLLTVRF